MAIAVQGAGLTVGKGAPSAQISIESGYFILTLMPSLYCHLRCPHCYLSIEERSDPTLLSPEKVRLACEKVHEYYETRGLPKKTIVCYWYGGEPTSMGTARFREMVDVIGAVFAAERGYTVSHTVLTSLVSVKDEWFPIFAEHGGGSFQSSYDGDMRGGAYIRKWDRRMREAIASGLRASTISVVNRALLDDGPEQTLDYLADIGVEETSWLPFMLNDQNAATGKYGELAPSMNEWSDFMIRLSERWLERKRAGLPTPEIGQMRFILTQRELPLMANVAGQTLFLMPNGDFVLPDYRNGWQEFMQPFGNILKQSFAEVLSSPARRRYLRRQVLRNGNADCAACDHADKCVMEFWKPNRPDDDCFGGRRYVEWVLAHADKINAVSGSTSSLLY